MMGLKHKLKTLFSGLPTIIIPIEQAIFLCGRQKDVGRRGLFHHCSLIEESYSVCAKSGPGFMFT
jgi:hypothetical protein